MGLRFASGDTTDIILTLARLTATTGLTGLQAECLSAPARGMAGDALGVGVAGAGVAALDAALAAILIGMTEGSAAAVSAATGALTAGASMVAGLTVAGLLTVRRASAVVTGSAATADFMVEVVDPTEGAVSMEVAGSTVEAVEGSTVAVVGIGNHKLPPVL